MNKLLEFILIKKILIFIFFSFLFSQYVFDSYTNREYALKEVKLIEGHIDLLDIIHTPYLDYRKKSYKIDLLKNNRLTVAPVWAIRFSTAGFEMEQNINSPKLWLSPGIKLRSLVPITFQKFPIGISVISWFDFYKHSAYKVMWGSGEFDDSSRMIIPPESYFCDEDSNVECSLQLQHSSYYFIYNPLYFNEFSSKTKWPNNGIDFDESKGGIVIDGKNFNIFYGKFRSSIGPFESGNLSISQTTPSFQQLKILLALNSKYNFSYLLGNLNSNVIDWDETTLLYNDLIGDKRNVNYFSYINRYVVNHRFDYKTSNFRIGFYEQVIFGSRLPMVYLNPITFYWSAQHQLGDLDNLQMGFDMEYLIGENRFYFAFMADEWAPFKTFNSSNHNWFSYQLGITRLISFNSFKMLLKHESTLIDPQVYTHKFKINEPKHHDYYLGFWTGSDSKNHFSSINILFENFSIIISDDLSFFGLAEYRQSAENDTYDKLRRKTEVRVGSAFYDFYISKISSRAIYSQNNYIDFGISVRLGINY